MGNETKGRGSMLLRGARAILPDGVAEVVSLLLDEGRIARVIRGDERAPAYISEKIDLGGLTLLPGFSDLHIHGAVGVDAMEASADDLHQVARFLASNGVTSWLPTLVPSPYEDYQKAVEAIEGLMREQDEREAASRVLGLHYEGPFVNRAQCGALRPNYFRAYTEKSALDTLPLIRSSQAVHMMTLAPEIEGGVNLVRELTARGWVVSIGHTRASVEDLERAREAGAHHMTHFMNAMVALHHRAPGPIGWGLLRDDITCDVIADGKHLDPLTLELVLKCKTAARVSLISDSISAAGLGDGEYSVWGETITVEQGRTRNLRGNLAGSVITMLDAARMMLRLGASEADVARMCSSNPARLIGREHECGSIEEGKRADLVAIDEKGDVRFTFVGGRIAYKG
ncbi:MAG: N-acetylglucosamine-6-phosphate deacetylase [Acidobacteria bacterium 13_1_20CM_3_53_8]|nr:MAG: N-acetylglucosamine-6-phosphate deacetylase [Acidobacteria bacterium 13_1_20CM_3_53_8]